MVTVFKTNKNSVVVMGTDGKPESYLFENAKDTYDFYEKVKHYTNNGDIEKEFNNFLNIEKMED